MRVPGINYHDRTSREVTLACYQLACEALEKELRRDTLAESRPLIACGAAQDAQPHEAAPNDDITKIIAGLEQLIEERRGTP